MREATYVVAEDRIDSTRPSFPNCVDSEQSVRSFVLMCVSD